MTQAISLELNKKIRKIDIIDHKSLDQELKKMEVRRNGNESQKKQFLEQQEAIMKEQREKLNEINGKHEQISSLAEAIVDTSKQFENLHKYMIAQHKTEIVRLSIEIAKLILLKHIDEGDYDIVRIIEKSLEVAPGNAETMVTINPADFETYSKIVKENPTHHLNSFSVHSDPAVPKGQCKVETNKGIIEYFIDEHLREIASSFGIEKW